MSCPSAIGVRSTSIGAPAAMVEASGFIWETNGQSVAAPPTAAAAPVATKRKSRRVGWSAEDAVVTIPNPFSSCSRWNRPGDSKVPGEAAGARDPPRRQKDPLFLTQSAEQAVQNRSIGTLAGRAQARYRLASVQCTNSARSDDLAIQFAEDPKGVPGCRLHFFNPTSPRTPGRLFGCANARAWRPISSNPPV